MDESYIHHNHFPKDCWWYPDRPDVVRPVGKGQRLIIVHAISRHGLAFANGVDGERPQPSEFDSGVYTTAEMVYRAKSSRGDYHDNMDTDTFLMWLDRCMVPGFGQKSNTKLNLNAISN